MLVYLDQNKWIELSRVHYGKDASAEKKRALANLAHGVEAGRICVPLSAIHYMEAARIKNPERRSRLGKVMWQLSGGKTLASLRAIVLHEAQLALARVFPTVQVKPFELVGFGIGHAFGEKVQSSLPAGLEMLVAEAFLTGEGPDGIPQTHFDNTTHRHNFVEHLKRVPMLRQELSPEKWDDALHAIALADIVEPFGMVMRHNNIEPEKIGNLGPEKLTALGEDMPLRHVDIHMHRQVLKNPKLSPKVTGLEDWAGLGVAVQAPPSDQENRLEL